MSLRAFLLPKPRSFIARVAGLAVLLPIIGWIGGGRVWLLDLFNHFQLQYAGVLALCVIALLIMKARRLAALAAVFLAVPVVRIAPVFFNPTKPIFSTTMRFASFNVLTSNNRYEDAVKWIRETDPDLIFLPEVDEVWADALSPLKASHPHSIDYPVEGNFGFAFCSKFPILSQEIIPCGELELPLLKAKLKGPAGDFILFGAHPVPPSTSFWASERDVFLARMAEEVKKETLPVVVLGDLNATRWCHGIKPLFEAGLIDSTRGHGIGPTWMRGNPVVAVPIDHVLFRGPSSAPMQAHSSRHEVGPDLGSDHRPVVAEVSW